MPYSRLIHITLGLTMGGRVLKAQFFDTTGESVSGFIFDGFTDVGSGYYRWKYDGFPSDLNGTVRFFDSGGDYLANELVLAPSPGSQPPPAGHAGRLNDTLWNTGVSIRHRLWQILLEHNFTQLHTAKALTRFDKLILPNTTPWSYGMAATTDVNRRGFVAIEDSGQVLDSVRVYVNSVAANSSLYRVDYEHGLVVFNSNPGGTVTADFREWQVEVREGYPDANELKLANLPVIAYNVDNENATPFAISGNREIFQYRGTIDILAKSSTQIQVLGPIVRKYIKWLPVLDFSMGQPLDFAGRINLDFNWLEQFVDTMRWRRYPSLTVLAKRREGTTKEDNRAMISFACEFVEQ